MTTQLLIALISYCFVSSITPGPNNLMLLASGVRFGFLRSIPHILGIGLGFASLLGGIALGLGALLHAVPELIWGLKLLGGGYMLWLAWRIATAPGFEAGKGAARSMRSIEAAAFQWVNPKAWMMGITAMTTYTSSEPYWLMASIMVAVFVLVNVPSVSIWTGFGTVMVQYLQQPRLFRGFSVLMGGLLVLSLWPMLEV